MTVLKPTRILVGMIILQMCLALFLTVNIAAAQENAEVDIAAPIDPTYKECFTMAENAMQVGVIALGLEASELGKHGSATPAALAPVDGITLPNEEQNIVAKLEQGVRLKIDPENKTAKPQIELDNVEITAKPAEEENTDNEYQEKRLLCKIKYGISF